MVSVSFQPQVLYLNKPPTGLLRVMVGRLIRVQCSLDVGCWTLGTVCRFNEWGSLAGALSCRVRDPELSFGLACDERAARSTPEA